MGIMTEITATTIVITAKANPTGTTTAPTAPIEGAFLKKCLSARWR